MIKVARKIWLPLLIVFVVVVAGLTVSRIRTFFGSEGIIETPRNFADLPSRSTRRSSATRSAGPAATPTSTTSTSTPSRSGSTTPRCRGR